MAPVAAAFAQWRSPPPQATPALEPSDLPAASSPPDANSKADVLHPSFLPPCEHGKDGGEMHAHAFDLLSLAAATSPKSSTVPASLPATSILSTTRPANAASNGGGSTVLSSSPAKARRMSSSTTGVLGRGKLGLTGDSGLLRDNRPTLSASQSSASAIHGRRASNAANGSPLLFDFAKTDRRPSGTRANARPQAVAASLPSRGIAGPTAHNVNPAPTVQTDDMELDMEFDGDDDDDRSGGRSGSAELDMDMDDDSAMREPDWEKLALGTGSGGIKGRRKGMVFKCENCAKEYRHPSCLVKHRWEHSPHWREPTQISMSKHQQVQMLEAAAILAHMDPNNAQGRSLPTDKSLWPAILSPSSNNMALRSARSAARDLPSVGTPPGSSAPPLTPSSLRDSTMGGVKVERKSSPASDSTSSLGGSEANSTSLSPNPNGLGIRINGHSRPMGISNGNRRSSVSSVPGPATPASLGSLPDMTGLHFNTGSTPTGTSPLPSRGLPLSLGARVGMIGGGMFGSRTVSNIKVPDSGLRGGVAEDDEDELEYGLGRVRAKSSSEEADERRRDDETGFEIDNMEL